MWVIFLEAGIALALLLIIVWATRPKRRRVTLPEEPVKPAGTPPEDSPRMLRLGQDAADEANPNNPKNDTNE